MLKFGGSSCLTTALVVKKLDRSAEPNRLLFKQERLGSLLHYLGASKIKKSFDQAFAQQGPFPPALEAIQGITPATPIIFYIDAF